MKQRCFDIYDWVMTILIMIFTPWGKGFFDRVRASQSRIDKFFERIWKL